MPKRPTPFTSTLVPFVLAYLRERGATSAADALAKRYLPGAFLGAPVQMPTAKFRRLLNDAARAVNDPLFGLHMGQAMPRGAYGLLEFATRSAPTARVSFEQLSRYGALINPAARFWIEPGETTLAIHHRIPEEPGGVGEHGNVFTVARLLTIAREVTSDALTPSRVWFAHKAKKAPDEIVKFFGTANIEFGRTSNGMTLDAAALDKPLASADPALNAMLREHANRLLAELAPQSFGERTRRTVTELLPKGEVQLAAVAKKLHVSERTLQRRLEEDGVQFAELVAEVRLQRAHEHLAEGTLPIAEIAAKLGYTDAAAFGRAFKRWTGKSPGSHRPGRSRRVAGA